MSYQTKTATHNIIPTIKSKKYVIKPYNGKYNARYTVAIGTILKQLLNIKNTKQCKKIIKKVKINFKTVRNLKQPLTIGDIIYYDNKNYRLVIYKKKLDLIQAQPIIYRIVKKNKFIKGGLNVICCTHGFIQVHSVLKKGTVTAKTENDFKVIESNKFLAIVTTVSKLYELTELIQKNGIYYDTKQNVVNIDNINIINVL